MVLNISRAASAALTLLVVGLVPAHAQKHTTFGDVISNTHILGLVDVFADDATNAGPKANSSVHLYPGQIDCSVTAGRSDATGTVADWNCLRARADARLGVPAVGGRAPLAISTAGMSSQFKLKLGRTLSMQVMPHFYATLNSGMATITINVIVTDVTIGRLQLPVASINSVYILNQDPKDSTKIQIMGSHTSSMINGGGSSPFVDVSGQVTLAPGDYTLGYSLTVKSNADSLAQVYVDQSILSLDY